MRVGAIVGLVALVAAMVAIMVFGDGGTSRRFVPPTIPIADKVPSPPASPAEPKRGCVVDPTPTATGISIERPTTGVQGKLWQPAGGELKFTVKSRNALDANSTVFVCFRWKVNTPKSADDPEPADGRKPIDDYDQADIFSVENVNGTTLTVGTAVPNRFGKEPPEGVQRVVMGVPVAEARILVFKAQGDKAEDVLADATTTIGVTSVINGSITALVSVLVAFLALWAIKANRPKIAVNGRLQRVNPFLGLIATPRGYASLSQLQVIIWTFVIGASAIYVMSLSGTLINITNGALVLLGISGTSVITSKLKSDTDDAHDPKAGNANAVHRPRMPRWSDLVINETWKDGRRTAREIDVARVQMLYFTIIAAFFVGFSVIANYVIPDIATNFLLLMGISNGVYVTAKYADRTGSKVAAPKNAAAPAPEETQGQS